MITDFALFKSDALRGVPRRIVTRCDHIGCSNKCLIPSARGCSTIITHCVSYVIQQHIKNIINKELTI